MEKSGKGEELFLLHLENMRSLSSHSWNCVVLPYSDLLFRRNYVPYTLSVRTFHLEMNKNKNFNKNE